MKHKHYTTPGDWRLTPDGERVESVSPELEGGIQPICDDIRHRGDGMKIAALPRLIAALQGVKPLLDDHVNHIDNDMAAWAEWRAEIEVALAEAGIR